MAGVLDSIRGALGRRGADGNAEPETHDSWLSQFAGEELAEIERACGGAGTEALPRFRVLDEDVWALLLTGRYERYPNIRALLPDLPSEDLQVRWNGAAGLELMNQGKGFYRRARELSEAHGAKPLSEAAVLDFGCGWGRLTRFFARNVEPGSLFACDPSSEILDVCRRTRVPAVLARSEYLPEGLPFERRFDLVYAFSVFTHLSEPAHERCLDAIHAALEPRGLLILTIRPPAYLRVSPWLADELTALGRDPGAAFAVPRYVFAPHPPDPGHPQFQDGEMTYGEAVVSLPYVRERWADRFELLETRLQAEDLHQVVLALRRRD